MIHNTITKSLCNYTSSPKNHTPHSDPSFQSGTIFTVIETFVSSQEAKNAALELQRQGLLSSQMVIITRHYQGHENLMNWEYIAVDRGLPEFLTELGLDIYSAAKFERQVKNGQFLLVAVVKNHSASDAQHLLANIGRKVIAVY